jgi:class 3 adenylate cyclase/tetratricopeptide (TPR) repeat protein
LKITDILEESLSRYSGKERLLSGRTRRLRKGERRRVAVVFVDRVGLTRRCESQDHEIVHSLVSRVMGFLSSVVESYGGYVDKFEGDRLMALFGARASAENDSARSVSCALRMLDILEEVGPIFPGSDSTAARIGIDFGSVTVAPDPSGHLTAMGAAVNLASRIEELAIPGTILVTQEVRKECGELFRFKEHETVDIRGISSPARLFNPLGPGSIQFERWQRARRLSDAPMVDRVAENKTLVSALQDSFGEKDKPVLIRITGEAGIGKSRLLHDFLLQVSGAQILHGHVRPYARTPFWIWIDILREYLNIENETSEEILNKVVKFAEDCSDKTMGAKLKQVSRSIVDLLSLSRTDSVDETLETSRTRTVAIRLMLDAISFKGSMILALEDMHWIDEPSMKVLKLFLESGRHFNPIMVTVTERPSERTFEIMDNDWTIIALEPLCSDDINSITSYIISDDQGNRSFEKDLEDLITRGARGNPFYAEELVLGLIDSGGIKPSVNELWGLSLKADHVDIPSSVQSIIQARIDKLPRDERKMLQLVSIIGVDFRIPVLERMLADLELEINLINTLDALIGKGFLAGTESDSISFSHDLVQTAAYSTMLVHNRRIIHRYIAEALESASMNEQDEEILRLTSIILDLASDHSEDDKWLATMKALKAKQGVLARSGLVLEALKILDNVLENARDRSNPLLEAEALRSKCILLRELGEMDDIDNLFKLALNKADEADKESLKGLIYGSLANYMSDTGESKEALEYYEKALAIHVKHNSRCNIAATYTNLGNLLTRRGHLERAATCYRNSIRISREEGSRYSLGYALNGYAITFAREGDLKEAG